MSMKRTRHMFKPYWIESPRMAVGGRIISFRMKISQVQLKDHGKAKYFSEERPHDTRGNVGLDVGESEIHEAKTEKVIARGEEYLPGSPGSIAPSSVGEIERGSVDGEEG